MNRLKTALHFFLLLAGIILIGSPARAVFDASPLGARGLGMGCVLAADPFDPSALSANPAAASWREQAGMATVFLRQWDLAELDRFRFDAVVPLGLWTPGISLAGLGRTLYAEREVSLSLSRRMGNAVAIGVAGSYRRVEIRNYGADHSWCGGMGVVVRGTEWSVGIAGENIIAETMDRFGETPPGIIRIAASLSPSHRLTLLAEAEAERFYPPSYRAGVEVAAMPHLLLRAGYDSGTDRFHLGFGVSMSPFFLNGAYDQHPVLGWSKAFGITWSPGESSYIN